LLAEDVAAAGQSSAPYVATTKQVWALHDAMPEELRAAILLAALAGLRVAERVAFDSPTSTSCGRWDLWPDSDEATRSAVEAVLVARANSLRTQEVIIQRSRRSERT
jgi:hypothetical protein